MKSIQISLKHSPESHSSHYLKECLESVLYEWEIFDKVVGTSSDTAANIKNCLKNLVKGKVHIPCICHVLNLIVKDVMVKEVVQEETSEFFSV